MCVVLVFQLESQFESSLVVGIYNAGDTFADKCSGFRVKFYLGGIRYLLYTNYYIHFLDFNVSEKLF